MKILYFGAEWCKSCKAMLPIVKEIANVNGITLEIYDSDEHEEVFNKYMVFGVPTLIIINGDKQERLTGSQPEDKILECIRGV